MSKFIPKLIWIALLALLPFADALAAQQAPQIWAIGNGHVIADILTATKMFIHQSGYAKLIYIICLIGFIIIAFTSSVGHVKPGTILMYFIAIVMITTVTFRATMNVTVSDSVNQYTDVVDDVPLAVALPATFISQAGHYMLVSVESLFTYPNQSTSASSPLLMSNSGQFNLVGQLISDGNKVRITDPFIRASMHSYIQDCLVPWLYKGYISVGDITHSKNLWKTVYVSSRSMVTVYYDKNIPNGMIVPCGSSGGYDGSFANARPYSAASAAPPAVNGTGNNSASTNDTDTTANIGAHERIADAIKKYAPQLVGQGFEGFQYTDAVSFFDGAYKSAYAYLADKSGPDSTAELLRNNAVINTYSTIGRQTLSTMGDAGEGTVYSLNVQQSLDSQRTGWAIAAQIFQRIMGYLYTVLQAFVLAIMPMAIVSFFIPSYGIKIASTIIKMMVWLALWIPALGIVNFIVAGFLQQSIGPTLGQGIDLANIGAITEQTRTAIIAASFFGTSVPLITWGLVSSGSFALTQFLSEGAGAIQARTAAQNIATSSVSEGQRTFDNVTSSNRDFTSKMNIGRANPQLDRSLGFDMITQAGGEGSSVAGQRNSRTEQHTTSNTKEVSLGSTRKMVQSIMSSHGVSREQAIQNVANKAVKSMFNSGVASTTSADNQRKFSTAFSASLRNSMAEQTSAEGGHRNSYSWDSSASVGLQAFGDGGSTGLSAKRGDEYKVGGSESSSTSRDNAQSNEASVSGSKGSNTSTSDSRILNRAFEAGYQAMDKHAQSLTEQRMHQVQQEETSSHKMTYAQSYTETTQTQVPVGSGAARDNAEDTQRSLGSGARDITNRSGDLAATAQKLKDRINSDINAPGIKSQMSALSNQAKSAIGSNGASQHEARGWQRLNSETLQKVQALNKFETKVQQIHDHMKDKSWSIQRAAQEYSSLGSGTLAMADRVLGASNSNMPLNNFKTIEKMYINGPHAAHNMMVLNRKVEQYTVDARKNLNSEIDNLTNIAKGKSGRFGGVGYEH